MDETPPPAIVAAPPVESGSAPAAGAVYARRRVLTNFFTVAGIGTIGRFLGIVIDTLARRALGPVAMGQLGWNASLLAYLNLAANPGMFTIAKRDAARYRDRVQGLVNLVLTLQACAAVVILAVAASLALAGVRSGVVGTLLMIQSIASLLMSLSFYWVLESQERPVLPSMLTFLQQVLLLPIVWLFVRDPSHALLYAALPIPIALLNLAVVMTCLRRDGLIHFRAVRPTFTGTRALFDESWPITLSLAATSMVANCGALILGALHGDIAVGIFTTALTWMLLSNSVSRAVMTSYFPSLARAAGDPAAARIVADQYLRLMLYLGVPAGIFGFFIAPVWLTTILGPSYAQAGEALRWLSLNVALMFLNISLTTPLQAMDRERQYLRITLIAAAANLVSNAVLIPIYGMWGAVAAALLTEAITLVVAVTHRGRWLGFDAGFVLWPIASFVFAAALSATIVLAARLPLAVAAALFAPLALGYSIATLGPLRRRFLLAIGRSAG